MAELVACRRIVLAARGADNAAVTINKHFHAAIYSSPTSENFSSIYSHTLNKRTDRITQEEEEDVSAYSQTQSYCAVSYLQLVKQYYLTVKNIFT